MTSLSLSIRRVMDPEDPAIMRFGELQDRSYWEPDLLIPVEVLPHMIAGSSRERQNYLVVAETGDQLVGGTVFHYFPGPRTGFVSFIAVDAQVRGHGIARALHDATFEVLDQCAGDQGAVYGLFNDVTAPERLSPDQVERERAAGMDPFLRRRIFARMGFRKVAVDYYQPPDGPGEVPITIMDLLYCPRTPMDSVPTDRVVQTMHAYWTPWLGRAAADVHSSELRRRCSGSDVPLLIPQHLQRLRG